jgi:hypothetical protein
MFTELTAEINCEGVVEKITFIDPAKVNKRIFVSL